VPRLRSDERSPKERPLKEEIRERPESGHGTPCLNGKNPHIFRLETTAQKDGLFDGKDKSGRKVVPGGTPRPSGARLDRALFYRVAVGVDFVDFADVEFANAGFYLAQVADHKPD